MMFKHRSLVAACIAAFALANRAPALATTYDGVSVAVPVSFFGYVKPSGAPAKSYVVNVMCTVGRVTVPSPTYTKA